MCLSDFLAFNSLPLKQTDMGVDSGGICQPDAPPTPTVARRVVSRRLHITQSRYNQKIISWMRQHIVDLEKSMKVKQAELDQPRVRPAPSTEHELYVLSEMELIYRQLESEYSNPASF